MANYLYNGVELPELPEAAKEEYPYAVIAYGNLEGLVLFLSKNPIKYMTTDGNVWGGDKDELVMDGEYKKYDRLIHDGEGLVALDYWKPSESPDSLAIKQGNYDFDNEVYVPSFMWANHDVLEGNIVRIAASEPVPVPVYDHTAMVQGWIVGKRLAAMRGKKEPVAYLYNGVRLPKLPELKHKYAVINGKDGYFQLYVSNHPLCLTNIIEGLTFSYYANEETTCGYYHVDTMNADKGENWHFDTDRGWETVSGALIHPTYSPVVWANYDVLKKDGTLYLAASEPVPVYE